MADPRVLIYGSDTDYFNCNDNVNTFVEKNSLKIKDCEVDNEFQENIQGDGASLVRTRYKNGSFSWVQILKDEDNPQNLSSLISSFNAQLKKSTNRLSHNPLPAIFENRNMDTEGAGSSIEDHNILELRTGYIKFQVSVNFKPFPYGDSEALPLNYLIDPKLYRDDNADGVANNWTYDESGGSGGLAEEATPSIDTAEKAQKITIATGPNAAGDTVKIYQQVLDFAASEDISARIEYKCNAPTDGKYNIYIRFLTSGDVEISKSYLLQNKAGAESSFLGITKTDTCPATTAKVQLVIEFKADDTEASGAIWVKNAMLVKQLTTLSEFYCSRVAAPETIEIPNIKGDISAPCQIAIRQISSTSGIAKINIGLRSNRTENIDINNFEAIFEAEDNDATYGTDTADASARNKARRYYQPVLAATKYDIIRANFPQNQLLGRYIPILRGYAATATPNIYAALESKTSVAPYVTDEYSRISGTSYLHYLLDEVTVPRYASLNTNPEETFQIVTKCDDAAANTLNPDYVLFLPSDEGFGLINLSSPLADNKVIVFDTISASPNVWWVDGNDNYSVLGSNILKPIKLWPGDNRLVIYTEGASASAINDVIEVSVIYRPQYLTVAGG